MKVAINIKPLYSAHKVRGIGRYTYHLLENLKKDDKIQVIEFQNPQELKEVDIVHYPFFDLYFHTLPIRKSFPTVVTIHDVIPLIFKKHYPVGLKGKINFFLQKIALQNSNAFITDSEASKKDIIKFLKLDSKKVFSIPLSADSEFKVLDDTTLLRIKRKYNLPVRFLLYVGDANWVKNLPNLVESFSKLIKTKGVGDLKLILVGGVFLKKVDNIDHPELESLKKVNALIGHLNLEEHLVRVGNIETSELAAFYNLATIYIQPSFYEGFGLPILEAFACGVPVICSNGGSLPEVGSDACLYFDPTNADQLIGLVLEVLQNKSLKEKLIKLGLKRADEFSWQKTAAKTIDVYHKILNK